MRQLRWSAPAEADLSAIDDYWWDRDRAFAETLTERIRTTAEHLRDLPAKGSSIGGDSVRKWSVARSPYLLIYRVLPSEIEILRVFHNRQDWRAE